MTADPELLAYLSQYREFHRMEFFEPYPKQWEFINLGAEKNERCLFAGNRYGKSETGAFETACHCTGFYPPEWKGRRFDHPVNAWVAGEGGQHNRDVLQYKLFGPPGNPDALGSGFIPRDALVGQPTAARGGVADAFDTAQIKHYTNGVFDGLSRLQFKSYEQGRKKFQGADLDLIWWDEEPAEDVYVEGKARTINRGGMTFMTFTPLQGMSAVVKRFWNNTTDELIGHVLMGPKHALHIGEKELAAMLSAYPKYQHRARMEGIPMLGTGAIFNANEEALKYDPAIYVPDYWLKLWGIDFGMSHPFAAVLCLWDRETDVFYVHKEYRVTGALPIVHADAILRIGGEFPVAWPHDGNRTESMGLPVRSQYSAAGLKMMGEHATFLDGSISTEAAILEMQQRMADGRFRVAADLHDWWQEYRQYHRDEDGKIVKVDDDLMSATMKAIMMKRNGRAGGISAVARRPQVPGPGPVSFAPTFDLFTGLPFDPT
jgi:phage terminase large subunit-like protein